MEIGRVTFKVSEHDRLMNIEWGKTISKKEKVCIVGTGENIYLPILFDPDSVICVDKDPGEWIPGVKYEKKDATKYDFSDFDYLILNRLCDKGDASIIYDITQKILKKNNKIPVIFIELCKNAEHYKFSRIKGKKRKTLFDYGLKNFNYKTKMSVLSDELNELLVNKDYYTKTIKFKNVPELIIAAKDKKKLERMLKRM